MSHFDHNVTLRIHYVIVLVSHSGLVIKNESQNKYRIDITKEWVDMSHFWLLRNDYVIV